MADWDSLDRQLFKAEKIEKALNHRFRGMRGCPEAPQQTSYITPMCETALDRMVAAVGMSDSFEIQYQQERVRLTTNLENGTIGMPNLQECANIMAQANIDALHLKHVHDVVEEAKKFREEAKRAIGACSSEIAALRNVNKEMYERYKESVTNHREVSIAFDELFNATLRYNAETGTTVHDYELLLGHAQTGELEAIKDLERLREHVFSYKRNLTRWRRIERRPKMIWTSPQRKA